MEAHLYTLTCEHRKGVEGRKNERTNERWTVKRKKQENANSCKLFKLANNILFVFARVNFSFVRIFIHFSLFQWFLVVELHRSA